LRKPVLFLFLLFSIVAFSIVIKTNEKGVAVYINNTLKYTIDSTGITLSDSGKVNIRLSLPGRWPENYELSNVDLSSTEVIEVNFYPLTVATITGVPEGSKIYIIDGSVEVPIGKAPYRGKLPLGRHVFKVITPEGFKYTMEKSITTDTQVIDLYKAWSRTIVIDSEPRASLYIDGVYKGTTPVTVTLGFKEYSFEFYNKRFLVGSCKLEITDEDVRILRKNIIGMEKDKNRLLFKLRRIVKTSVYSVPKGTFFTVNGKMYRTPEILELPESTNVIEAFMPGYKTKKVVFNPAVSPSVRIELDPDQMNVRMDFHGELFVNGDYKGTAPTVINLLRGVYVLESVNGESRWLALVDVSTDTEVNLNKDNGTLVMGDIGVIKLNDSSILTPSILNLPPGNYEVTKVLKDGSTSTETLTVERGKVTYYPKNSALLFVESSPPGVRVKVNGKYYTTPLILLPVEPGEIELEFQYKCATLKKVVKAEKGKINFVKVDLNISLDNKNKECPILIEEK